MHPGISGHDVGGLVSDDVVMVSVVIDVQSLLLPVKYRHPEVIGLVRVGEVDSQVCGCRTGVVHVIVITCTCQRVRDILQEQ